MSKFCSFFTTNITIYVTTIIISMINCSCFLTYITCCITVVLINVSMTFDGNSNCCRSTEVVILNCNCNGTNTIEGDCAVFPVCIIVIDSHRNGIAIVKVSYRNIKRTMNNRNFAVVEICEYVAKLVFSVIYKCINITLELFNRCLVIALGDTKVSYNTTIFLKADGAYTPAVACEELIEGKEYALNVLSLSVIMLTTGYRGSLVCINNTVSISIGEVDLGVRNTAKLIVIGTGITGMTVLLKLTVVIVVPVTVVYSTVCSIDTSHIGNSSALVIRCIMTNRADNHTRVTVCVVLIVTANVVVNIDLCRNVTVRKGDCIATCVLVTTEHTNKTATGYVVGAPKSRNLVSIINSDVAKNDVLLNSRINSACDADDTTVTGVVNARVTVSNCDILEVGVNSISCDYTGRCKLTVRGEVIYCKVLNGTAINVTKETHSSLIIVAVIVAPHLPGILVEVSNSVTVTVKCTLEGGYVCSGSCAIGGLVVMTGIIVITNRVEDIAACVVLVAKVNVSKKLYGLAKEGIVVMLVTVTVFISNNEVSVLVLRHTAYDLAKTPELVCVCDGKLGCVRIIPSVVCLAFPNSRRCNKRNLGEGCKINRNLTGGGIVFEGVVINFRAVVDVSHRYGARIFYVVESVVTDIKTLRKNLTEIYLNRLGVACRNSCNMYVKREGCLVFVKREVRIAVLLVTYNKLYFSCTGSKLGSYGKGGRNLAIRACHSNLFGQLV